MKYVDKTIDIITILAKCLVAVALTVMLFVSFIEVVRRYFFSVSFPWGEESIRFLLVWVSFVGGAVAYKDGGLVLFSLLVNRFPKRVQAMINLLTNTAILIFCVYMLRRAWVATFYSAISMQTAIGLGIPMKIPYTGISVGLALFIIYSLNNYRKLVPGITGREGG